MTPEETAARRVELQRQLSELPANDEPGAKEEVEQIAVDVYDLPKLLDDPMPSAAGVSAAEWFKGGSRAWHEWCERYRAAWAERFELGYRLEGSEITPTDRMQRVPSRDVKWYRRELNGPWVAMSEDEVFYIQPEQPIVPDTEFIPHYDATRAKNYESLPYYCKLHGCLSENNGWPGPFHALPGTAGITNQLEASRLLEGVVHQGPNHHLYPGTRSIDRLVEFWKRFGIKTGVPDILDKLREQSGHVLAAREWEL